MHSIAVDVVPPEKLEESVLRTRLHQKSADPKSLKLHSVESESELNQQMDLKVKSRCLQEIGVNRPRMTRSISKAKPLRALGLETLRLH